VKVLDIGKGNGWRNMGTHFPHYLSLWARTIVFFFRRWRLISKDYPFPKRTLFSRKAEVIFDRRSYEKAPMGEVKFKNQENME